MSSDPGFSSKRCHMLGCISICMASLVITWHACWRFENIQVLLPPRPNSVQHGSHHLTCCKGGHLTNWKDHRSHWTVNPHMSDEVGALMLPGKQSKICMSNEGSQSSESQQTAVMIDVVLPHYCNTIQSLRDMTEKEMKQQKQILRYWIPHYLCNIVYVNMCTVSSRHMHTKGVCDSGNLTLSLCVIHVCRYTYTPIHIPFIYKLTPPP